MCWMLIALFFIWRDKYSKIMRYNLTLILILSRFAKRSHCRCCLSWGWDHRWLSLSCEVVLAASLASQHLLPLRLSSCPCHYVSIWLLDNLFVIEVNLSIEKVLMIFFHDVFDLIQIFLGEFIAVLENCLDLVVDCVEGVEVFLLEVPLLRLIRQQRYLVSDLLVVLNCNFDSSIV